MDAVELRIGETKSATSNGYVAVSPDLEKDLRMWLNIRSLGDAYHRTAGPLPNDLLFPSETGTPYRIGNYLKRVLKPIAESAGISDLIRRCAAHSRRTSSATAPRRTRRPNCGIPG